MSKRLVNANEIIKCPECSIDLQNKINQMGELYTNDDLDGEFVRRVVQCGDCAYRSKDEDGAGLAICHRLGHGDLWVADDWLCASGRRG